MTVTQALPVEHRLQAETRVLADSAARRADDAWSAALRVLRDMLRDAPHRIEAAIAAAADTLATELADVLARGLARWRRLARRAMADRLSDYEAQALAAQLMRRTTRRVAEAELLIDEPLVDLLHQIETGVPRPITPAEARQYVADVLYPPLDVGEAARLLGTDPTFRARLSSTIWTDAEKSTLRAAILRGVSDGRNIDEIVRDAAPLVAPVRWKVRRVVRTEMVRVAQRDAMQREMDALGDAVQGIVIQAVLDNRTRPEHRDRHGTTYWRQRDGTFRAEDGTLAPELPDAPNCRCYYVRIYDADDAGMIETGIGMMPDRATYESVWDAASPAVRARMVGAANLRAARQQLGREPTALDMLDESGRVRRYVAPSPGEQDQELAAQAAEIAGRIRRYMQYGDLLPPDEADRIIAATSAMPASWVRGIVQALGYPPMSRAEWLRHLRTTLPATRASLDAARFTLSAGMRAPPVTVPDVEPVPVRPHVEVRIPRARIVRAPRTSTASTRRTRSVTSSSPPPPSASPQLDAAITHAQRILAAGRITSDDAERLHTLAATLTARELDALGAAIHAPTHLATRKSEKLRLIMAFIEKQRITTLLSDFQL